MRCAWFDSVNFITNLILYWSSTSCIIYLVFIKLVVAKYFFFHFKDNLLRRYLLFGPEVLPTRLRGCLKIVICAKFGCHVSIVLDLSRGKTDMQWETDGVYNNVILVASTPISHQPKLMHFGRCKVVYQILHGNSRTVELLVGMGIGMESNPVGMAYFMRVKNSQSH